MEQSLAPLSMMVKTARRAADDAGAGQKLIESMNSMAVINNITLKYQDLTGMLAGKLEVNPRENFLWPGSVMGPRN